MKVTPVPVKIDYQLSTESVGTIVGWLVQEMASFKLHPEAYTEPLVTEQTLRTICKEMNLPYWRLWMSIQDEESEGV